MLVQASQLIKNINRLTKENHSKDAAPIQLEALFTHKRKDIIAAQKLRYRVFTEEYGAKIRSVRGIDKDRFDKHCLHLIVKDTCSGEIIGYTRVLTLSAARLTNGFYSSSEFDLTNILKHAKQATNGRMIEIGRTCIDSRYRNGGTIGVLWAAIGQYLQDNHVRFLIGCASISMMDGGIAAHAIMKKIRQKHLTSSDLRVTPYKALDIPVKNSELSPKMPPLLKAYLGMGAKIAGEPYWDIDFNVADVFILLDMETVSDRYKKHFLRNR